jgi:hypothetical protein
MRERPGWRVTGGGRISILRVEFVVEQTERYRSTPSASFRSAYSTPSDQPSSRSGTSLTQISTVTSLTPLSHLLGVSLPHRMTKTRPLFQATGGGARRKVFGDREEGELLISGGGRAEWRKETLTLERPHWIMSSKWKREKEKEGTIGFKSPFLTVGHESRVKIVW